MHKSFKKIWSKIEDEALGSIAKLIVSGILVGAAFLLPYTRKWLVNKYQIELYGYIIAFVGIVLFSFLLLLLYKFFYLVKNKSECLINQNDIIMRIEEWFKPDEYGNKVEAGYQDFYRKLEKDLNLKKGSLKLYLPLCAFGHRLFIRCGEKIFTLQKLQSSVEQEFSQFLKELEKTKMENPGQAKLRIYEFEDKLDWPRDSIYLTFESMFPKSIKK